MAHEEDSGSEFNTATDHSSSDLGTVSEGEMVSLQDSIGAISEGDAGLDVLVMEESLEAGVGGMGGTSDGALEEGDAMEASFGGVSAHKELLEGNEGGREHAVIKEPTTSEQ